MYSIIIPTYSRALDLLGPCIDSIIKHTTYEHELIIVANGCPEGTQPFLEAYREKHPQIRVLWNDHPIGYTKAVNQGLSIVRGEKIILLNDDTQVLASPVNLWIDLLEKPFLQDPSVGITGPIMLHYPPLYAKFLVFAIVMFPKSILEKIGYLNEIFNPGYGEDVDYAIRIRSAGYKVVKCEEGPFYHLAEGTVHGNVPWESFTECKLWDEIVMRNLQYLSELYPTNYEKSLEYLDPKLYVNIITDNEYGLSPEQIAGKTVIDIGANIGLFTAYALKCGAASVIAVEPVKDHFTVLQTTYQNDPRVKLIHAAVTGKTGDRVSMSSKETTSHIIEGEDVITISLEDILAMTPSWEKDLIVKIDTEGSEFYMLSHLTKSQLSKIDTLFIEIHEFSWMEPQFKISTLREHIKSCGFEELKCDPYFSWVIGPNQEILEYTELPVKVCKYKRKPELQVIETPVYKKGVTVGIPTKDRYENLGLTLQSIINQTHKPNEVIIVDDSQDPIDIRIQPNLNYMLQVMTQKGIEWKVIYGEKNGPHRSHQIIQDTASYEFIWRIDDDEVAEPQVLARLMHHMTEGVGAVAPAVIIPPGTPLPDNVFPNLITHLDSPNYQWFHSEDLIEAEHLYSSFLYRKGIVDFPRNLSKAGHREETIFTHSLFKKGYKLIVDPQAVIWHYRAATGGIRQAQLQDYAKDNLVFQRFLSGNNSFNVDAVLNCGIGDHMAFKHILPKFKQKKNKLRLAVCYPDLFWDIPDLELISIEQANHELGNTEDWNIYSWMAKHNWKGSLVEAFEKMYL